ncbi:MAG: hypothetical protein GY845_27560 [Planctomycetes bacterium]|nr:hypothetical protein [Planctomycetota bacterium]
MFGSEMLEVAVGMMFIFLLLSLICSAISEVIDALLKMRAKDLEQGIRELLNDPKGDGLTKRFYSHPLVSGLFRGTYDPDSIKNGRYKNKKSTKLPSYIPARTFALALMDIVLPAAATPSGAAGATPPPTLPAPAATAGATPTPPPAVAASGKVQPLRDAIENISNPKVKQALMTLVDAAGDDISNARENIEAWFNSAMDRVSGWYKRRTRIILLFLGLFVAVAVNADTIIISNSLSNDEALRQSLVTAVQEYTKNQPQDPNDSAEKKLSENLTRIQKLGLPIGWNNDDPRTIPTTVGGWITKALGWLITAIAISLGAPFWFDLLNKFTKLRSSIKSPTSN